MSIEGIADRILSREAEQVARGLDARLSLKGLARVQLDEILVAKVGTEAAKELLKQTPMPPITVSDGVEARPEPPQRGPYPLIVGYYTLATPYEQEAKSLRLSIEVMGLEHEILGVPNLGDWQKNTQYKAVFLRERMKAHPGRPLLYIDVDAILIHPPELLARPMGCDIAACKFGGSLRSGTVYLAGTPKCRELVEAWVALNEKYPERLPNGSEAWDQRTLQMAVEQVPDVRFSPLPTEYCWIAGLTAREHPGVDMNPVIVHTRGAYRLKAEVNAQAGDVTPWVAFPSITVERAAKCTQRWHDWGYKVAVLIEQPRATLAETKKIGADKVLRPKTWVSFPVAANALCRAVPGPIVVLIGDDILPHPQESGPVLARRFMEAFPDTMGVMQPTGDAWGGYKTACISPWIGRAFIEQAYGGKGPYHAGYFHYFSDQELQEAAVKLGCFKQDREIYQFHDHWQRRGEQRPGHLLKALDHWEADRQNFKKRQAEGFPGCEVQG